MGTNRVALLYTPEWNTLSLNEFKSSLSILLIMVVISLDPSNALSPIAVNVEGNTTLFNFVQVLKAYIPIEVTPSGITTLVSEVLPSNADCSIVLRLSGSDTLLNFEHPLKALAPITLIPSFKVNFTRLLLSGLFSNADTPIESTLYETLPIITESLTTISPLVMVASITDAVLGPVRYSYFIVPTVLNNLSPPTILSNFFHPSAALYSATVSLLYASSVSTGIGTNRAAFWYIDVNTLSSIPIPDISSFSILLIIVAKLVQSLNAYCSILSSFDGISTQFRFEHPSKARNPIDLTPFGIITFVNNELFWKAYSPIVFKLSDNVTELSLVHPLKAYAPTVSTFFGTSITSS